VTSEARVPLHLSPVWAVFDDSAVVLRTLIDVPDGIDWPHANVPIRAITAGNVLRMFTLPPLSVGSFEFALDFAI
jgi:hypothetical protein